MTRPAARAGTPSTQNAPRPTPLTRSTPLTRPDGSPLRVLVVDDEPAIVDLLAAALRFEGWEVRTALTGTDAVREATAEAPDVVVLDLMLPDVGGLDVMRRIRTRHPRLPVLLLTARDALEDKVAGLTAGGDDYVVKPFSLEEVAARLTALVRRAGAVARPDDAVLTVGDLQLDEDAREVTRAGEPIHLSATEFDLLRLFMRNPRRVLSKAQILDRVWHYDFGGQVNIVELYVSYLRRKIDAGREPMIHTLRGVGYILKPAEAPSSSAPPAAAR